MDTENTSEKTKPLLFTPDLNHRMVVMVALRSISLTLSLFLAQKFKIYFSTEQSS